MPALTTSETVTVAPRRLRLAFLASCIFFVPVWLLGFVFVPPLGGCVSVPAVGLVGLHIASIPLIAMISEDGGSWIGNRVLVIAIAFVAAALQTWVSDNLYTGRTLLVFTAGFTMIGVSFIPALGVMLHALCDGSATHGRARAMLVRATGRIWGSLAMLVVVPWVALTLGPIVLAIGIMTALALAMRGVGERALMPGAFADLTVVCTIVAWLHTMSA